LTTELPEVTTESPELYDYYQKIAFGGSKQYQCVYDNSTGTGK
jgi:hypothetical protein